MMTGEGHGATYSPLIQTDTSDDATLHQGGDSEAIEKYFYPETKSRQGNNFASTKSAATSERLKRQHDQEYLKSSSSRSHSKSIVSEICEAILKCYGWAPLEDSNTYPNENYLINESESSMTSSMSSQSVIRDEDIHSHFYGNNMKSAQSYAIHKSETSAKELRWNRSPDTPGGHI
jgi:hypothetical protein